MKSLLQIFLLLSSVVAQQEKMSPLLIRVDEETFGPFGRSHSHSCMEIYEDGRVLSAESSVGRVVLVDALTHKKSLPDAQLRYGRAQLEKIDAEELEDFLLSSSVQRLRDSYPSPYRPVDYIEKTRIEINNQGKIEKSLILNEYGVADLKKKSKYPAALIVLMDKLAETRERLKYDEGDVKLLLPCEVIKQPDN